MPAGHTRLTLRYVWHLAPTWTGKASSSHPWKTTVKAENVWRDARVSLCVDGEELPFSSAVVERSDEITVGDPDHL